MMLVTVVTVAYNSEATVARTIEAVFHQTYQNIEYIIIDGASTDNTAKIAQSYLPKFAKTGRSLRIISEKDNGMYDALNKGIAAANGVIIGSINADDWYEPDAVKTMADLYQKEKYDAAWGSIRIKKPTGDMIKHAKIGRFWTTTGWCHPAMFATKKVLTEFPYVCRNMYDDFNFITTAHCAGKKIVTIDKIISNFSFGGMSTKRSLKEVWYRASIKYDIYREHGMSRLYWPHCISMELAKYILG